MQVHNFLSKFRVSGDNSITNVLSQPGDSCRAGKWFVPDDKYLDFLKIIHSELETNPKSEMHFLEKPHKIFNMIKFDLDLRFTPTDIELKNKCNFTRRYNIEFVETIIRIIAEVINEFVDITAKINIYVQEKENPRITVQNFIKDGIHIIIPDVVLDNKDLYYIREQIIENQEIIKLLKDINNTTNINEVFDECIIGKNAWYVYGCGKPDDKGVYYKVTNVYKITKKDKIFKPTKIKSTKTVFEYINLFTNFGKQINPRYNDSDGTSSSNSSGSSGSSSGGSDQNINKSEYAFNNPSNEPKISSSVRQKIKLDWERLYPSHKKNASKLTVVEIKPFLHCIKKERADDYMNWWTIGVCLYNMDSRNYDIWSVWSSQSEKYNENNCYREWYQNFPKNIKYNMGLTKLKETAKRDNPEEYKKISNINKRNFFDKWIYEHAKENHVKGLSVCTLSDNIKTYIKHYSEFSISCACPGTTNSLWYKFDNHKWTEDKAANKIYMVMTRELKNDLTHIYEELKRKVFNNQNVEDNERFNNDGDNSDNNDNYNGNGDGDGGGMTEQQYLEPPDTNELTQRHLQTQHTKVCAEKCGKILEFIATPMNKKKIIEDLSQKAYDEQFLKNLDDNKNVFACNNGVLDLEQCIFRSGEPSDMITISSNIDFPSDVDSLEANEILIAIQEWLDKIFVDSELQDYVLNIFAQKLSGKLFWEKFHIFTGSGANGKSQFFKFINKVFGDYSHTFDNTILNTAKSGPDNANPAIAALKGKRVVVTSEPKSGKPFESDKIKELTGGDELSARNLFQGLFKFFPQYAMFLQCNDIPENDSTDDGFWRRIFVIEFMSKFISKEEDMYKLDDPSRYPNHFKADNQEHLYSSWAPYFLHMLFKRFIKLKSNDFKYAIPDSVFRAIENYKKSSGVYTRFFNEKLIESPGYKIDNTTLYNEFKLFVDSDFKPKKMTFMTQMEKLLGKAKGHNKEYHGFKLRGSSGEPIDNILNNNGDGEEDD